MFSTLLLIFLISTFDLGAARNSHRRESIEYSDSNESGLENVEDFEAPVRLPRRFANGQTRIRRLHIENQTGFDGKVKRIHVDSNENRPGIRAYGLPKKNLQHNGDIERISMKDAKEEDLRNGRLIEAYGMPKERLENNGQIIRLTPSMLMKKKAGENTNSRIIRSIVSAPTNSVEEKQKTEAEDLEAQDAKVFRPLFVYRQQVARRQGRTHGKYQFYGRHPGNYKTWNDQRAVH